MKFAGHILFCLFVTQLAVPNIAAADSTKKKKVDQIAAVVGTDIILLSDVYEKATPALAELKKAGASVSPVLLKSRIEQIQKDTLNQMIDEKLVYYEAKELEVAVASEEVDRAMLNMAQEQGIDIETVHEAIKAQGMDIASYRNQIRSQLLRYKVLNLKVRVRIKISDVEARQYYNDQVREVRATGSFEGAHVLIRLPSDAKAKDTANARKRAEEILTQIKQGRDFAAVAKSLSDDKATSPFGGSLGRRQPGQIPEVLEKVFTDMEVGEMAGPIRTSAGFHILKLNDREALGVAPFVEVKGRILAQLSQEEMVRQEKIWLKELRNKTFIDIRM